MSGPTKTSALPPSVVLGASSGGIPAWTPTTVYPVNVLVTNGGVTYICKVAHTSGGSFSGAGTNWQALGSGGQTVTTRNATGATALAVGSSGAAFVDTLTGNVTYSAPTGAVAGTECSIDLELIQDATGGRTVTWFAGITWLQGSAPSIPTGAGTSLLLSFVSLDGGTTWFGSYGGSASIEAARVVGAGGQPAFQNSWVNVGAPLMGLQFRKSASGMVYVQGAITKTVAAGFAASIIFTLPAGYRPLANIHPAQPVCYVGASQYATTADVLVASNGDVTLNYVSNALTGGTSQLFFNLAFPADQ